MRLYLQFLFLWLLALPAFARLPHNNVTANGELGADTYGYGVRMPHAVKTVGSIRSYGHDANGT